MEWGIRELFLALGVLGVVAILGHGLWVRWRDELPLRVDPGLSNDDGDELDLTRSELPNGGARVVSPGSRAAGEDPEPVNALAPPKDDPLFAVEASPAAAPAPEAGRGAAAHSRAGAAVRWRAHRAPGGPAPGHGGEEA